ncbi:MAG: autotransporter-associated beta strand repeat-containing protein, partial [Verrucomicrobiota bacterium]
MFPLGAQVITVWDDGGMNNSWTNVANWNSLVPDGAGDSATFGDLPPGTGQQTVVVNSENQSVGEMIFAGTEHNYRLRSSGANRFVIFDQTGDGVADLEVSGNQQHVIGFTNTDNRRTNVAIFDDLLIQNNSTAESGLTFGTLGGDHFFRLIFGDDLFVTGTSRTIIHSQILDSGGITQNGSGILRLTDTANSFSGGVVLDDGTIEIGSNAALGTGDFTIDGGSVEAFGASRSISNDYSINDDYSVEGTNDLTFTGTGVVTGGPQEITVAGAVDHTLSGTLSGAGGITKEGDGTLTFTVGSKTFSGGLIVNDGTVDATRGGDITLGAADGANNIAGAGAITVNNGGTLNLSQTVADPITLRGEPLTNNGGTINIDSAPNEQNRDFFIGTNAANPGQLVSTGGTTTVTVGDDIQIRPNSEIIISGGVVQLNAGDEFATQGTSGDGVNIDVTNTGSLTIDITGPRNNVNRINIGENDEMTVDGATASINLIGQTDSTIELDGSINLFNNGTITVEQGTTEISSTATVDGGSPGTAGTLELQADLVIDTAANITNSPNLTFNTGDNVSISGTSAGTETEGWGTITQAGSGTTTIDSSINDISADTIRIENGTLLLGSNDQIGNSTDMVLAGGTLNTNNFNDVLGTLTLTANSVIDFGDTPGDGSILQFADSSGVLWDPGATLTIVNWEGIVGTGNGIDQLFFGSNDSGLSAQQRSQIVFADFPGDETIQLADGEVVPVPEPAA